MERILKPAGVAVAGMMSAVVEMTAPMFVMTGCFVIADVITACRLQRRLRRAGKLGKEDAKFSSARIGRVFVTLTQIMGLLVLTAMADYLVLGPLGIPALKMVAGGVCFWHSVSLLENEAAENGSKWAVHARRFLVDKAKRYMREETGR